MAAKLKSILRPIHWSLVLRAAVFCVAWLTLPLSWFLVVAFYLYLFPLFKPLKLALPFLIVIFFAAVETPGVLLAILFSIFFYLILGIKDLIFIDRKTAYEILVLLLLFLVFIRFFSHFDGGVRPAAIFYAFVIGAILFFLAKEFLGYSSGGDAGVADAVRRKNVISGIIGLVVLQLALVFLFLPINFLYQAAAIFLAAALLLELAYDYLGGKLTRRRILASFSALFVFLVVILGSVQWGP